MDDELIQAQAQEAARAERIKNMDTADRVAIQEYERILEELKYQDGGEFDGMMPEWVDS